MFSSGEHDDVIAPELPRQLPGLADVFHRHADELSVNPRGRLVEVLARFPFHRFSLLLRDDRRDLVCCHVGYSFLDGWLCVVGGLPLPR